MKAASPLAGTASAWRHRQADERTFVFLRMRLAARLSPVRDGQGERSSGTMRDGTNFFKPFNAICLVQSCLKK
jgi:hypothetical protein